MSIQDLNIAAKENLYFTPKVSLNVGTGICSIEGESYISYTEDAALFYFQIHEWIKAYFAEGHKSITFNFKLLYFNSSSSRCIVDLMKFLVHYHKMGNELAINWHVDEEDKVLLGEVEDFREEIGFQIDIFPFQV